MKQRYTVFLRPWGVYYCQDLTTGKQQTLKTRDKDEAYRLVAARNENEEVPAFSLHLARVYWKAGDPAGATRTRQDVMDEIPKLKTGGTQHRWLTAIKDKALDSIRKLVVLETQAEYFLKVLENGSVSTDTNESLDNKGFYGVRGQFVEIKKLSVHNRFTTLSLSFCWSFCRRLET